MGTWTHGARKDAEQGETEAMLALLGESEVERQLKTQTPR
jgi:hypothetical protein